jgi:hypothetical protein
MMRRLVALEIAAPPVAREARSCRALSFARFRRAQRPERFFCNGVRKEKWLAERCASR